MLGRTFLTLFALSVPVVRADSGKAHFAPWVSCFAADGTLVGPAEQQTPVLSAVGASRLA